MAFWSRLNGKSHRGPGRTRRSRRRIVRPLFLTSLEDRCVPTGTVWTQRGGDGGHTGYVDVSVNGTGITPAWNQPITYNSSGYWAQSDNRAVAIDDTRVYRTELDGYWASGNYHVMAYDLQTGAQVWNQIIVGNGPVSAPSVADGMVYINRSGHSGISGGTDNDKPWLYQLTATTGSTVTRATYAAQWSSDERPTILGGQLVAYYGYYGGMGSWAVPGLAPQWNRAGSIYENPTAAMDSTYIYAYGSSAYSSNTQVFSRATGTPVATLTHPTGMYTSSPVVPGTGIVLVNVAGTVSGVQKFGVAAYDSATRSLLWTAYTSTSVSAKAVGNGIVAVVSGQQLTLLDEATGAVIRTWQAPSALTGQLVLTRTHAFVESDGYPYGPCVAHAVNLATAQSEWSYQNNLGDENGSTMMDLAFGGGRLILSHDGFVRAFDVSGSPAGTPDAVDDTAATAEDTAVTVNVLANDSDPEGDPLTVTAITQPAHGSAVLNADNTVTYTPAPDFNGTDSFTYTISDGNGGTDTATVRLTVTPVADPPVARNDAYTTDEDVPLGVSSAQGVLVNDTDADGQPLTAILVAGPGKGILNLNANGSFTYTPAADANGTDTFTYKASDGVLTSNVATVTITINPVNDAPVARDESYTTDEDVPLTLPAPGVLGNDTDPDDDSLSPVLVTGPTRGTLQLNPDGSFTYTPNPNVHGTDSFTYRASDGSLTSNLATVSLTVNSVEDPPVAVAGPDRSSTEGAPVWFDGTDSYDPDGDSITHAWNFGDGGTATGATPFHYFTDDGTFTVTLTVTDVHGNIGTDTMVLTVDNVPPAATVSGPATGVRGQPRTFHLTATDVSTVDQAAPFTYSIDWGDATGTQILTGPGNLWADHAYADVGSFTVTVTATDKDGGTGAPAVSTITISAAEMQGTTLAVGGTTGDDTIVLKPTTTTGDLDVSLNGASLGNFRPTGQIQVFGQAGNDTVQLLTARIKSSTTYVKVPAFLFGGAGNDTVDASGSSAGNVLIGGDGIDALTGGRGRDLLLGGLGADGLHGGGNADLLIGGTTDFDGDLAALAALRAEWVRTDVGYAGRINHLTGVTGGGLNGTRFLTSATVHDDGSADQLFGDAGQDWFLYRPSGPTPDVLGDRAGNETATEI